MIQGDFRVLRPLCLTRRVGWVEGMIQGFLPRYKNKRGGIELRTKLANMLSDGLKQSDRIILDNRDGTSLRQIIRAINARLNVNAQIAEVWVYDGDSILDIYP